MAGPTASLYLRPSSIVPVGPLIPEVYNLYGEIRQDGCYSKIVPDTDAAIVYARN